MKTTWIFEMVISPKLSLWFSPMRFLSSTRDIAQKRYEGSRLLVRACNSEQKQNVEAPRNMYSLLTPFERFIILSEELHWLSYGQKRGAQNQNIILAVLRVESSVMTTFGLRHLAVMCLLCGSFTILISVNFITEAMTVFSLTLMYGSGVGGRMSLYQIPQYVTDPPRCKCQLASGSHKTWNFRREKGVWNHARLWNRLEMKLKIMIKACHTKW